MTAHQPIPIEAIRDAAHWRKVQEGLETALTAAESMADGRKAIGEALCAALDTVGAGAPRYEAFGDIRESAGWWADVATPMELEAFAGAALRRIERATFAPRTRKRLFNMLWQTFTPEERSAFLEGARKREG